MELAQLRELLKAQPFKPFEIRLVDGRTFEVRHPEFCFVPRSMKHTFYVEQPGVEGVEILDSVMIVSVRHLENGMRNGMDGRTDP